MSRPRFTVNLALCSALALAALFQPVSIHAAEPAVAAAFELPKWETGEKVKLAGFAGDIVVLDFFAYWCAPCKRASVEVEAGIQKFYAGKKGNPHGVPVRVVSINVEKDNPKLTGQYLKQTGAEFVLNDFGGALLAKLGGAATPYFVILDGTRATKDAPEFRVLYQNAGFEGTKKLRQIIDAIKPPRNSAAKAAADKATAEKPTGPPVARRVEAGFDALAASDIQVFGGSASYGQKKGGTEWKLSFTHNSIDEDYEPFKRFDFLGFSEKVHADYNGGQASIRQKLTDSLTAQVAGGAYNGFTDFRSLWLSTYYRQQYEQFFPTQYERPEPQGFNAAAGLRWEYQPTAGFAEAGFLYANDQIAPGYERDPNRNNLLVGREILHTYSPTFKFENVLALRVRALNEFQLTITSGREARYAYRGAVNVALGERWVARASGGYTREDPTLRAWFAGATLEFEVAPRWLLHASGRYYHDTGEIENSLLISSAAPGLATWQAGGGLRYAGERMSFSVSVAPVFASYQTVDIGTRPFTNLYQDRTWISAQVAWTIEF